MAAITSAVLGAGMAIKGQRDQKKAANKAMQGQEAASFKSAAELDKAGKGAAKSILDAQGEAERLRQLGTTEAAGYISPYAKSAEAYNPLKQQILAGGQQSGPLANAIMGGAMGAVPGYFDASQGAQQGVADMALSRLNPAMQNQLMNSAQQGIAAQGDLAGIRARGFNALGDIAGQSGAARASALIGQVGPMTEIGQSAQEARLLAGVAGQKYDNQGIMSMANLAGRVI